MMSPEDKVKIKEMLEEMLTNLNDIQITMLMYNGQSVWAGSPFELVGWLKFIGKIIMGSLLASTGSRKSNTAASDTMH